MLKSRMFEFIDYTDNCGGGCCFDCAYCWTPKYRGRNRCELCRKGTPHLHVEQVLTRKTKPGTLFFFDMGDIACLSSEEREAILTMIRNNPQTTFFLLTKDPRIYLEWVDPPGNMVLGATIETNRGEITRKLSKAPEPAVRFEAMIRLSETRPKVPRFISIEPILDFDPTTFELFILAVNPDFGVAIGYDNHNHKLNEPTLDKTLRFKENLEDFGITVYKKTIQEAWYELSNSEKIMREVR